MCMGSVSAPPPVQQTAPQVTPPTTSPDAGLSGMDAAGAQRRRAQAAAGLNINIATNPMGLAGSTGVTTRSGSTGLLG